MSASQRQRCMFRQCRFAGTLLTLDGRHERVLCETHASGIREALQRPGTFEVHWGLSSGDKLKRDERRMSELTDQFGEPPDDYRGLFFDLDSDEQESPYSIEQEEAWDAIDVLRENIAYARDEAVQPPAVWVSVRST